MTDQPAEEVLLEQGNIKVTTSRLLIGSKTFAISNITSVVFGKIKANKLPAIIVVIAGVFILLFGIALDAVLIGLILGGATIAGGVFIFQNAVDRYSVRLESASGESDALSSKDKEWIRKIVDAINEAIIRRG